MTWVVKVPSISKHAPHNSIFSTSCGSAFDFDTKRQDTAVKSSMKKEFFSIYNHLIKTFIPIRLCFQMTSVFFRNDSPRNVSETNLKHRMNGITACNLYHTCIFCIILIICEKEIRGSSLFFRINNDILILSSIFPNKQPEKRIHAQPCLRLRHFAPQDAPITSSTGKMIRSVDARFPVSCSAILRNSISTAFRPISYCG